jgi:hypothetical protein
MENTNHTTTICQTLRENEVFCRSNSIAHQTLANILELANDAIDQVIWITRLRSWESVFGRFAIMNYVFAVLQPLSYGILLDFLAGNLPACLMQLSFNRTIGEMLQR